MNQINTRNPNSDVFGSTWTISFSLEALANQLIIELSSFVIGYLERVVRKDRWRCCWDLHRNWCTNFHGNSYAWSLANHSWYVSILRNNITFKNKNISKHFTRYLIMFMLKSFNNYVMKCFGIGNKYQEKQMFYLVYFLLTPLKLYFC